MTHMELTRRTFVVTTAAACGGLILGVYSTAANAASINPQSWLPPTKKDGTELSKWVMIDPEGTVTIRSVGQEMGQGIFTAQPMMFAEELSVDWRMIRTMHANTHRHVMNDNEYGNGPYFGYGIMKSGASANVIGTRVLYQQAGASARERLKAAAAQAWGVDRSQVAAIDGVLSSGNSRGTYGEFATAAAAIQLSEEPTIKTPDQYTLMGTSVARLDVPSKVNGSAEYGIDARLPGMVYAAVMVSPVPGGTLKSYDFDAIADRPGIIQAVGLETGPDYDWTGDTWGYNSALRSGVAVVADSWYRAKTALELMPKEWDDGPGGGTSNEGMFAARRALLDVSGEVLEGEEGEGVLGILANSNRLVSADYQRPYASHSPIEPMNATVSMADNRVDVFVSTQDPPGALKVTAHQMGVELSQVYLHPAFLGGGFGRRLDNGEVRQTAEIARQVGRPVKLVWTREEDTRQNPMRSLAAVRLTASLDRNGIPEAFLARTASESLYAARRIETIYDTIPNQRHEYHSVPSHIPTTYLRGVWAGLYGFMSEQFVDEMALAGGHDPLDFRFELTRDKPGWQPILAVLKERSGFTTDLPRGEGMGVAISEEHAVISAMAATVTVSRRGQLRVEKIVSVVDSGHMVNPLTCIEQMEGGIALELSHTLRGAIEIRGGQVVSNNFDTYQLARISDMPEVDVIVANSGGERWGGIGERGLGPLAPSIANAIYFATGKRVRSTPLINHDLSWS